MLLIFPRFCMGEASGRYGTTMFWNANTNILTAMPTGLYEP